jgi:AbrB family looped-hinge helix DNA binding protein
MPAYGGAEPPPAPQAYAVMMADRGRLVLPAEVRERLKIKEGDRLTLRVDADGTIRLQTAAVFARGLVGMFKHLAPGRILSDELIAERRREAATENRKDRAFTARDRLKRRR